ncbi:MAG: hypothetical protein JO199_03725, partial [Candidatus Eremiobacteraeota bacterium]|nr:hypothetical protein [Candidatus Eremiobacteraeota bacterium]
MKTATTSRSAGVWALPALLFVGLLVRLIFIPSQGYINDVNTFEAWALSLAHDGFAKFYTNGQFADYPPGYLYVLAPVGWLWNLLAHMGIDSDFVHKTLVKMPAILADLGIGALLYGIARRFASRGLALGTAALYVLNPAIVFDSAWWGQIDSVAGLFALLAIYCLLRGDDELA